MGRRFLAAVGALLVLLLAAVPAYAASPTVDPSEFDSVPWSVDNRLPFTGDGDVGGDYQIYPDYDNHRLYIAVSVYDPQVAAHTKKADISLDLRLSSPKFNNKKFTFVNGAATAEQSCSGFGTGCRMDMEIDRLQWSVEGSAYLCVALDKSLCGPLTARLDYSCGGRSICVFENAVFDYTLPEKTDATRSGRAGHAKTTKHTTTKKKKATTTKFHYTGTVPSATKSATRRSAQTATKFTYSGSASGRATDEEQALPVAESGSAAVVTDGAYTAAVAPTHRSTAANILIYLAVALATAAIIAIVAGIVKSRRAKQEAEREKQRRLEEQEIEEYDE